MLVVARLADVVEQQRQHEQLRRVELAEQPREPLPFGRRFDQPLEVADRQQRVLVDRVLVIEVAHHAAADRLELGKHLPEQPESCISDSRAYKPGRGFRKRSSASR